MKGLKDRVVLVTGAASGIGLATARRFNEEGSTVVASDVDDAGLQRIAAEMDHVLLLDVTNESEWQDAVSRIVERCGGLDILVNNAGIDVPDRPQSPESVALDDWRRISAVNLDGLMLGCRSALAAMTRSRGGSIVNLSSVASLVATPDFAAYGATKAAVAQYTKSVAAYCARAGSRIRCNSVHPGIVETPLVQAFWRKLEADGAMTYDEARAEFLSLIPIGEFAAGEDVAAAIAYLASDEARHVTGAQLVVDGGITLNAPG